MTRYTRNGFWLSSLTGVMAAIGVVASYPFPTLAQITPDQTLGAEASRLTPNVDVRGGLADRIDGGAIRGSNLFHSFQDFNVKELQRVYFANPQGIENILGRVTGSTRSNILGTLGVDGGANLFLINPNGILFGPNAKLDIRGSFLAGTADGFKFPDGSEFRAKDPNAPPLVTVNIPIGLQYGPEPPAALMSQADLTVGRDLKLSGGSVTSTGKVSAPEGIVVLEGVAGDVQVKDVTAQSATLRSSQNLVLEESQLRTAGDLNLLADGTVRVRDSADKPFVAQAGGQLLVQGNQGVDIFALNHPSSGLFSGGNMVLRSANTVGGDAHYTAGGSFRIEQLDNSLGNLFSPHDPVVRASGDVNFASYTGASLHILAGGSVTITGNVEIINLDAVNGLVENVTLSDKTVLTINGKTQPTLDIRAGTTAFGTPDIIGIDKGTFTPTPGVPVAGGTPTSANITIGSITNSRINGRVFLTNQYKPNLDLPGGSITVTGVDVLGRSISAFGNPVTIDARGDIIIAHDINSSTAEGTAGEIKLLSGGSINTRGGLIFSGSDNGNAGDIILSASGDIITNNINSQSRENGDAGNIILNANGNISTISTGAITSSSKTGSGGYVTLSAARQITTDAITSTSESGNSGSIYISSSAGGITSTGLLNSRTTSGQFAGYVFLDALGQINTTGIVASSESLQGGTIDDQTFAGGIYIYSRGDAGGINTSGGTLAATSNSGQGGYIVLDAIGQITTGPITSQSVNGNGGNITLTSKTGFINTSAGNLTSSANNGNGGTVELDAAGRITTAGISSRVEVGTGIAGDIILTSRSNEIDTRGGTLSSSTANGDGGKVTLDAAGNITTANIESQVRDGGTGIAGDINLISRDGNITLISNNAQGDTIRGNLTSSTANGQGGKVTLDAAGNITTADIESQVRDGGTGIAGNITLTSDKGFIDTTGGTLSSSTSAPNNDPDIPIDSGNVILKALREITTADIISSSNAGNSGNISLTSNAGTIDTTTGELRTASKEGKAGDVFLNANLDLKISKITASSAGKEDAGNLTLTSNRELSIVDGVISSQTRGEGSGGIIRLLADSISLKNSQVSTSTFGQGNSGRISVRARNGGTVSLEDNSSIQTSVELGSKGDGSNINITAGSVFLRGGSRLEAQTRGSGKAGNIRVNASDTVEISGFSTYEDKSGENQVSLSSGILTSTEARDSGKGGDIIIGGLSKGTLNLLQVSDGGVLSALTRSSSRGGNIKVDVNTLEVTNGGQLIASTFRGGPAGNILVNATDSITISGSNPNFANANGSTGNVNPTGSGRVRDVDSRKRSRNNDSIDRAQEISFNSFSVRENDDIEFSTEVPHLSIISPGTNASKDNSFDYYSFKVQAPGTSGVFDIDRGSTGGTSNLDTQLFLFDANGKLLTSNDDSSTSSGANGSTSTLESYFSYDFSSPGKYIIGVGKYPSSYDGKSLTGQSLQVGDQYNLQVSLETRNNPNQGANSGLFAQSTGTGKAGDVTLNTRQLTVENQGIISTANTTSNAVSGIALQGLDTLVVNNGLISATTKSGQAGNITVNARESVQLNGTLTPTPGSESQGGLLAAATAGGNAGNLTITTDQLTIGGGAAAAVSSKGVRSNGASGNAGNVDISARVVSLNSQGEITADTEGGGSDNTGTIDLRNLETLRLDNARISSSTQSGVAGSVSIDASKSVAVNNSLISSSAQSGTAGSVTVNALDSVTLSGTTTSQSSSKPVGGVLAQATAGGNAGDLKITTNQLVINNGAAATVSSQNGSGNAGGVTVSANTVKLDSGGQISADTDQGGSQGTGNVSLKKLQTLDVNNGLISSSTNSGFAGSVIIDAAQTVLLSGTFVPNGSDKPQGGVLAESKKGGEAGAVTITTNQLTIDKGAAAAVSSQEGAGNAGDVTVSANTVKLDSGGQISADTDQGGRPGTGNVFLRKLQTLDVNNGLISSSTNSGLAGSVIIDAAQSVLLSGTFIPNDSDKPQGGVLAEAKKGGEAGAVRITTNQLTIDKGAAAAVSSQERAGNAGDVTVTANIVKLNSGGQIAAETDAGGLDRPSNITLQGLKTLEINEGIISASTNTGVAGSLSINASDSVKLDNDSRIAVTATGENGTAGNLTINTGDFLVRDNSEVSVSSEKGEAGNLNVNADFIGLNRGSITATAGQGEGGANIDLNVTGFLRLDNESLISAEAKDKATGGNINISAQYILASFPTGPQGSDIVADAILGNGGQITINALGIFGIQFRPLRTPLNDITASSQSGASGTVQLTTLGIDPSRGLAALPLNFVDVSGLVGGQCSARNSADGEQSQFTITGRGGIPLNPTDPLGPDAEQVHWVSLDSQANWVSLNPEAVTQMRITPFNSASNLRQLAQFPVLCYQSWLSPTTNAH